jgi:hypothetical protein
MKTTTILATLTVAAMTITSQATTTALGFDFGAGDSAFDLATDNDANTLTNTRTLNWEAGNEKGAQSISFTVTGLNIDGVGANDDSAIISFQVSGTPRTDGGTNYGFDGYGANNEWGINSNTDPINVNRRRINTGESLTVTFTSASLLLNGAATTAYDISFDGFDTGTSTTTAAAEISTTATSITFDSQPNNRNFSVKNTASDFTITAVPEPSSAALLGLGGLALILRRRK